MKWFYVLIAVAAFVYLLTTESAQSILRADPMDSAQGRVSEAETVNAPTEVKKKNGFD